MDEATDDPRRDNCPECGADLKSQGYPYGHQHDATGEECGWSWEPLDD